MHTRKADATTIAKHALIHPYPRAYPTCHRCRKSCGACDALRGALRLQRQRSGDAEWAAASSFRLGNPLTPKYPPGSKVVVGVNRCAHVRMAGWLDFELCGLGCWRAGPGGQSRVA